MVASVTTKLCTPVLTVTNPLIQPKRVPIISIKKIDGNTGRPTVSIHQPPNIAEATPSAPSERLRPPVRMTTIIAKPIIISIATTRESAKILNLDVNPSVEKENMATKNTTKQNNPNWFVKTKLGSFLCIRGTLLIGNL